jgi:hypothetical protein
VVRDVTRDYLVLLWLSGELEELLGQLPGRFYRFTATGGEEDPVEVARRGVGQPLGQLNGLRVGVGPQREVRQFGGLLGRGLGELAPSMPDPDSPSR